MSGAGRVNLRSFHIGVDLGQRVYHTALVVVEQEVVVTAVKDPVSFEYLRTRQLYVRMVERVRLGQGFQEIVSELERLTHSPELSDYARKKSGCQFFTRILIALVVGRLPASTSRASSGISWSLAKRMATSWRGVSS